MIALSCFERIASSWPILALSIAWVSSDTVIVPAITSVMSVSMMSVETARCSSSRLRIPSVRILSSVIESVVVALLGADSAELMDS